MATLLGAQSNTFDLETLGGGGGSNSLNDFRLSLDSASAVTTTDMTGKSTIYMTPFTGYGISLYNGSSWSVLTSGQVSYTLSGLTSGKNYDLFAYNNSGTLTLEAVEWTDDTTRATELAYQNGVACKTGSLTKRYVGSFRTTSTTTTEDSVTKRFLWNMCNRKSRQLYRYNGTSHDYTSFSWRAWNNDAANSRVEFILGLKEECVSGRSFTRASNTDSGVTLFCGGTFNATNTSHTHPYAMVSQVSGVAVVTAGLTVEQQAVVGYNYFVGVQNSGAAGTSTWEEMSVSGEVWA